MPFKNNCNIAWITKDKNACITCLSLSCCLDDDSLITGPVALKSYYAVTDFDDKKTKFSFKEGTTVQVLQKDPGGKGPFALHGAPSTTHCLHVFTKYVGRWICLHRYVRKSVLSYTILKSLPGNH